MADPGDGQGAQAPSYLQAKTENNYFLGRTLSYLRV